jgi:hypothetical protein
MESSSKKQKIRVDAGRVAGHYGVAVLADLSRTGFRHDATIRIDIPAESNRTDMTSRRVKMST